MTPGAEIFDQAGRTLQRLRESGREVRRASLVNDVLTRIIHERRGLIQESAFEERTKGGNL